MEFMVICYINNFVRIEVGKTWVTHNISNFIFPNVKESLCDSNTGIRKSYKCESVLFYLREFFPASDMTETSGFLKALNALIAANSAVSTIFPPLKSRTLTSQLINHTFSPLIIQRDSVSIASLSLIDLSNSLLNCTCETPCDSALGETSALN